MTPLQPDVLILGGGLAGPAAAIALARAGRRVTLVERESGPRDKVCGEFLSAEALRLLHQLGLDVFALGALPLHAVRFCGPGRSPATAALPFPAASLRRRCLDAALLEAAANAGATVLHSTAVETLTQGDGLWHACLSGNPEPEDRNAPTNAHQRQIRRECSAPCVILSTGKHDLRGLPRPAGPQNDLVALKMYLQLQPDQAVALHGHVELLLYPGGYAGLQTVGEAANLCCLVTRQQLANIGGWPGLLALIAAASPHARQRLHGAIPLLPKPLAVSSIPYGFLRRHAPAERLWAVGDQAAVIPSFTGDGMSLALYTGLRAAEGILKGESAEAFQGSLHRTLAGQLTRATALSRALLHPPTRTFLAAAVTWCPSLLRSTARWTRLPTRALAQLRPPLDCRSAS